MEFGNTFGIDVWEFVDPVTVYMPLFHRGVLIAIKLVFPTKSCMYRCINTCAFGVLLPGMRSENNNRLWLGKLEGVLEGAEDIVDDVEGDSTTEGV